MSNNGYSPTWTAPMQKHLAERFNAGATTVQLIESVLQTFQVRVTRNAIAGCVRRLREKGLITRAKVSLNTYSKEAKRENARVRKQKQTAVLRAAPAPRVNAPVVYTEAPVPESLGVTLGALERHQCHYPSGQGHEVTFCGHQAVKRGYCAAHAERCYKSRES